jgi:hypothetical protein
MARRSIRFTEQTIAHRIRAGYGSGVGRDYRGWFTIRDFSTKGIATRFASIELNRVLLFLSNIELNSYLIAARRGFVDFWEQYPMERDETQEIARYLGVRHPVYVGSNRPVVMTLDGVATFVRPNGEVFREVLDCKPRFRLGDPRTLEKLAIHEEYARRRGWTYRRFTEHSVPRAVIRNLTWFRMGQVWPDDPEPVADGLEQWAVRLHRRLREETGTGHLQLSVRTYCHRFDVVHRLPVGCAQRCLQLLLLNRLVDFDLNVDHLVVLRGPVTQLTLHPPLPLGIRLPVMDLDWEAEE